MTIFSLSCTCLFVSKWSVYSEIYFHELYVFGKKQMVKVQVLDDHEIFVNLDDSVPHLNKRNLVSS